MKKQTTQAKLSELRSIMKKVEKETGRVLAQMEKVRQAAFYYRVKAIAWMLATRETLKERDELYIRDRIEVCAARNCDMLHSTLPEDDLKVARRVERQLRADMGKARSMVEGRL